MSSSTRIAGAWRQIRRFDSAPFINHKQHLSARYAVKPHYVVTNNAIHENPYHYLYGRTMERWGQRTDPLWWSCSATLKTSKNRVVRSYISRKLKLAWVESMRKHGWARDGSRLPGSKQEMDLEGTLQMNPLISILKLSQEEIEDQTEILLNTILRLHAADKQKNSLGNDTKHISKSKSKPKPDIHAPTSKPHRPKSRSIFIE